MPSADTVGVWSSLRYPTETGAMADIELGVVHLHPSKHEHELTGEFGSLSERGCRPKAQVNFLLVFQTGLEDLELQLEGLELQFTPL